MQDEEKQSIFDKARSDAVRKVAVQAAQSTVLAEELLHRKLERGLSNDEKMQDIVSRLEALGPPSDAEDPQTELERKQLQHKLQYTPPMGDFAATNILRALSSVSANAAKQGVVGTQEAGYEQLLAAVAGEEF